MIIHKIYENNPFCSLFMDNYDLYMKRDLQLHNKNTDEIVVEKIPTTDNKSKSGIFGLFNRNPIEVKDDISDTDTIEYNARLDNMKNRIDSIEDESFTTQGISFGVLWDFIEFVEFAKKTIGYNPNGVLRATIKMDDIEHRIITLINPSVFETMDFIFDLYNIKDPNSRSIIDCIKITTVDGDNKFNMVVSDAQIDFNDESNVYLMNSINYILCDYCKNTFECIFMQLDTFFEERLKV